MIIYNAYSMMSFPYTILPPVPPQTIPVHKCIFHFSTSAQASSHAMVPCARRNSFLRLTQWSFQVQGMVASSGGNDGMNRRR